MATRKAYVTASQPSNNYFWGIAVELQLYMLCPFLLQLVSRIGWRKARFYSEVLELAIRGAGSMALLCGSISCSNGTPEFRSWHFCSHGVVYFEVTSMLIGRRIARRDILGESGPIPVGSGFNS